MAITRNKPGGVWMYSVYIPGSLYWLRGSTGTTDSAEAHAVEALLKMATVENTTRDRLLGIIDALYPVDPADVDDVPLDALPIDLDRAAEIAGKAAAKDNQTRRRQNLAELAAWTKKHWPAAKTLRGMDRSFLCLPLHQLIYSCATTSPLFIFSMSSMAKLIFQPCRICRAWRVRETHWKSTIAAPPHFWGNSGVFRLWHSHRPRRGHALPHRKTPSYCVSR